MLPLMPLRARRGPRRAHIRFKLTHYQRETDARSSRGTSGARPVPPRSELAVPPAHQRTAVGLGLLEADQVTGLLDHLQARAANVLREDARVERGDEAVARPPEEEGGRLDSPQPVLEAALRDGEEEL